MEVIGGNARAMFASRPDPYEGAELATLRKVTAALLGLSALLALSFFPIDPPSDAIGWPGWVVAGLLVAGSLAGARAIVDPRAGLGFDALFAVAFAGVAQVAVLEWLAGSGSPYYVLFVLWLGAGAAHPPRRAFLHLAVLLAALALPLVYDGYDSRVAATVGANALLLLAIGTVLTSFLFHVRRQRTGLRRGAEVARRLAGTDPLTGLGNRRSFDDGLTVEIARAERDGRPLSVGLVDLDNLKRINDRWGHLEGDRCLRECARGLESAVRTGDRCFRWGGDEFAVLLPSTDRPAATYVLQRVTEKVSRFCRDEDGLGLELSFGVGQLVPGGSGEDLLAMADLALMEQKTEKRR